MQFASLFIVNFPPVPELALYLPSVTNVCVVIDDFSILINWVWVIARLLCGRNKTDLVVIWKTFIWVVCKMYHD